MNSDQIRAFVKELFNENINSLTERVDQKIKSATSLSIKYWYPTIISIIAITSGAVYWYSNQSKLIEDRITKIELTKSIDPSNSQIVKEFKYILKISPDTLSNFSEDQKMDIKNIAYTLLNQRKDLIVVITGYSKSMPLISKQDQLENTERVCKKIAKQLMLNNLDGSRIFIQGRGPDVPELFSGKDKTYNGCIMLCDIFSLLKEHVKS